MTTPAWFRSGRHHRRATWSDRSAGIAAWLVEAASVVRSALLVAAGVVAGAAALLAALPPWRV